MGTIDLQNKEVTLRPRRQLTLPADVCEALGVQVGDRLELSVEGGGLLLVKPKKAIALEALREIQQAFADSELTEKEFQQEGERVRKGLSRARYGQR